MIKKILNLLRRKSTMRTIALLIPHALYSRWIRKKPIKNDHIVLEAQHGEEISGNIFYIMQELASNPEYSSYTIYLAHTKAGKKKIQKIFDAYGINNIKLVKLYSLKYLMEMAVAKYFFNDTTFLPFFVKREGQIYLNTWHGTPLKTLGKEVKNDRHAIGNVQKNFVCADYLLYPNKYTMDHLIEDYMLANIAKGKCVLSGYPRNTIFFNKERAEQVRATVEPGDKKLYAYMPTWRGTVGNVDDDANLQLRTYFDEIDSKLTDNEILYVNLHPFAAEDIDFTGFTHIKKFPKNYETYDFLNCIDCLITDYSSVFYDFAVTGKKCVFFAYDEEEYFADRGVYAPFSALPFPNVKTVDDLLKEIRSPKNYDDSAFMQEYCAYDNADATKAILDLVFKGKVSDKIELADIPNNGKKNILLFAGNLDRNGITTSIYNLLKNVDTSDNNYYMTFTANNGRKHQDTLAVLPEGANYFPMVGRMNMGLIKSLVFYFYLMICYIKKDWFLKTNFVANFLKEEWKDEIERLYGGAKWDDAIQFNGYSPKFILLFSAFDCNNAIFVHNDMVEEIRTKHNQRQDVLEYAYSTYDNVALVTEDLFEPTSSFVKNTDNFKISHNIIAYEEVIERGNAEIAFDEDITQSNVDLETLKEILDSDAKVFITVGRFSPEKGHKRMINAFNKVWQNNPNTYFVIIGGYQNGGIYDELTEYIKTLPCGNNVILILSMSNPLPIVKACDGFILGSFYEGFGLVIVEADILGLPVVSTDITGPRIFMQKNNGTLVTNDEAGIEEGFRLLIEGKIEKLTTDYKKYNENAINEFYALLD